MTQFWHVVYQTKHGGVGLIAEDESQARSFAQERSRATGRAVINNRDGLFAVYLLGEEQILDSHCTCGTSKHCTHHCGGGCTTL